MRDVDGHIRGSLERLTEPYGDASGADALWSDLVGRRRRRRARNAALAALPLLLVAVVAVGALSGGGADDERSDVAAGGDAPGALQDFAAFEMTYRTQSHQGGQLVPSTWTLRYESWDDWELVLVETSQLGQPWHRQTFRDATLTEYRADGTVMSDEVVEGPVAPLALMSRGPRTRADSESADRHEFRSTQEFQCADDTGPWCDVAGEPVAVETVEIFNADGVPVYASEVVTGTGRVVWQFEVVSYERTGAPALTPSLGLPNPSGGVRGPVIFGSLAPVDAVEQPILAGRVLYRNDCLYLHRMAPEATYPLLPVVWPNGTTWQEAPEGVRLPDGTFVPVGESGAWVSDDLFLSAEHVEVSAAVAIQSLDALAGAGHVPDVVDRARECDVEGAGHVAYVHAATVTARTAAGAGPGGDLLTVEEALTALEGTSIQVEGYAYDYNGLRLCSELWESYPPTCGEHQLLVEGAEGILDGASEVDSAGEAPGTVRWLDEPVIVTGVRDGDVIRVDGYSRGK